MTDKDEGLSNRRILRDALRDLRRRFGQFLTLEILIKVIALAVSGPLSAWLLSLLVSTTGRLVISNEDLFSFLLSLTGIGVLALWGAIALAVVMAEQAGPMIVASETRFGRDISSINALLLAIKNLPALFGLGLIQVAIYIVIIAPFAVLMGLTYSLLLSGHDINHFLAARPPAFWIALATSAPLLLGLFVSTSILYIRWTFALPVFLFQKKGFVSALRESHRLVKGSFARLARILLAWDILIAVAILATASLFDALGGKLFARLGDNLSVVIPVVTGFAAVCILSLEILFFLGFTIHCVLVTHLFYDANVRKGTPLRESRVRARAARSTGKLKPAVSRGTIWLIAVFTLLVMTTISVLIIEDLDLEDRVEITAHRGSSKRAPENTLSAIRMAIEDGAHYAEVDVQQTADGVVILLHDKDLMRVTNTNTKIAEATYDQVKDIDVGSWFSPKFKGETIPTLQEAIDAARGKIKLNIEVKSTGKGPPLVQKVVEILRENQFLSQCVITSLDYDSLRKAKSLDEDIEVGYVIFESLGRILRLDVEHLNVRSGLVTPALIKAARRRNKRINAWTVNDPRKMADLLDIGVDGIITDYPGKLAAILEERATLSDVERLFLRFKNWLRRARSPDTWSSFLGTWFRMWLQPRMYSS